jgi:hypothetical protein
MMSKDGEVSPGPWRNPSQLLYFGHFGNLAPGASFRSRRRQKRHRLGKGFKSFNPLKEFAQQLVPALAV